MPETNVAPLAPPERRHGAVPAGVRGRECAVVVAPDITRDVGIGAERDRHAPAVQRAQEVLRGVELAGGLAQAGCGYLDRDAGRCDRIGRPIVLARHHRLAGGVPEDLGEVEVREHVEDA